MELVQRLVDQWAKNACGLTIDIVGNSELSSEVQWVLAVPVDVRNPQDSIQSIEKLRDALEQSGLQRVPEEHFDPDANLPNGTALESTCPYRPESCLGDHLVAAGHGLVRDVEQPRFMRVVEDQEDSTRA